MPPRRVATALWLAGIGLATLAFWKQRIVDAATRSEVVVGNVDIHTYYYPMAKWGFGRLFGGELAHWNPYQLGGVPFQAIPHVGLFYPLNWIHGLLETGLALEVHLVLHLFTAAAGAFWLGRTLGLSAAASLMLGFGFAWSGWMVFYSNQPTLIAGMSWLPLTLVAIERVLVGGRLARIALVGAIAVQVLVGAVEFLVQNLYVAGGYALLRLAGRIRSDGWRAGVAPGLRLIGCVACGLLLASAQLLPSLELARESVRGGRLSLEQVTAAGTLPLPRLVLDTLGARGIAGVGVLPLLGLVLGFRGQTRGLWVFALLLAGFSALLAGGGALFGLYYETPLGALFRRPHKLLHAYAFGMALLAGLAVAGLEARVALSRRALVRDRAFLAGALGIGLAAVWLGWAGQPARALMALAAGLLLFPVLRAGRGRQGAVAALLLLQGATLFFAARQPFVRPWSQLERFHEHDALLVGLGRIAAGQRVYIEPDAHLQPGLMQKTGMLHGIRVLGDYEPLASMRAAEFFRAVSPWPGRRRHDPFDGAIRLGPESDWDLLDLTATRFYVLRRGTQADLHLLGLVRRGPESGVTLRMRGFARVYERGSALPRARFVARARPVESAAAALAALGAGDFEPRREVVLEGAPPDAAAPGAGDGAEAVVEIVEDERERVVLRVETPAPGFLVLADAYHPAWEAWGPRGELPLYRANHLFRAVPVPAGETRVELRYRPAAFRSGLALGGAGALLLLGLLGVGPGRRR